MHTNMFEYVSFHKIMYGGKDYEIFYSSNLCIPTQSSYSRYDKSK